MPATKTYRVVSPPDRDTPPEGFPVFRVTNKDGTDKASWVVGDTLSTGDVSAAHLKWFLSIGALEEISG